MAIRVGQLHKEELNLLVLEDSTADVILGRPWLVQQEVPITLSLRHCSNKYKLAREGEKDKEKDEDFEKVKKKKKKKKKFYVVK